MSYWFQFVTLVCPMCGKERRTRHKMTGIKPKDRDKTHIIVEVYDCCEEW